MWLLVVQEMIPGLVFSKDRALPLDATLTSFFTHAKDASASRITVLYKASSAFHKSQYETLGREYSGRAEFVPEVDFRQQVLDLLISALPSPKSQHRYCFYRKNAFLPPVIGSPPGGLDAGHVLFLVDSNIFVHPFEITSMVNALGSNPDALGFSHRLGTNTTYCYTMNTPQTLFGFESFPGEILKFQWTKSEGDFAYPLEVSSSIYSLKIIPNSLVGLQFQNPNTLELNLSTYHSRFRRKFPALLCFKNSVVFCAPINRVQNTYPNRAGQVEELSSQHLAEIFAQGFRIDVDAFHGFVPSSCHQEVELKFDQHPKNT